jgi:murein DD-endopeptidase MepM/ murein hydrolase activator NlpD
MLKFIISAITTVCGLPLKDHQFNKLVRKADTSLNKLWRNTFNYLESIFADIVFLIKILTLLRPRKRILTIRTFLLLTVILVYLFVGPNTTVNATFPEKVIQPQTETAVIVVREAITVEAIPEFKSPTHGYISTYYSSYHRGVDIPNPTGTPVKPFADGEVVYASWAEGGFGKTIVIQHNLGYVSKYAHLSSIEVEVGQKVTADTVIGRVGSTGNSTGSHLHLEIYQNDRSVNPLNYIDPRK